MSVPASLRSESKLEVIIQARSLASYTINITKNQKTFPPEYNNGIKQKVNDCYNAWKAHASHGNNYQIIMRMDAYYKSLWKGENNGTN